MQQITKQLIPTGVLQAVVDYLETRPLKEVKHLVEAILEHSKPHLENIEPTNEPEAENAQQAVSPVQSEQQASLPEATPETAQETATPVKKTRKTRVAAV